MNTWTQKRIKATKDVWRRVGSITKRLPAGGGDGLFRLPSFAPHTPRKDVTAAAYWEPKRLPPALREDVVDFFRPSKFLIHEAASPDANDRIPIPQVGRRSPRLAQATAADDRAAFLRKKNLDSPAAGHDGSIAMEARPFPLRSEELPPPVATFDPEPHPQRTEVPLTQPVEAAEDATSKAAHRVGERDKFPAAADPKGHKSVSLMEARPFPLRSEELPPPVATFDPEPHPQRTEVPLTQPVEAAEDATSKAAHRVGERDKFPAAADLKSIGVGKGHRSVSLMEARPFPLRSKERGRAKQALSAQRLLAQQKQDEAATSFRARPLPAASKGFAPQRSERPLTETKEFRLSSQARHERAEVHALPPPVATFDPEPHPQRTEVPLTQPVEAAEDATSKAAHRVGERDKFPAAADPKAKPSNAGIIGIGREGARAVFKPRHSNKPLTQQAPFRPSIDARATKRVPSSNRRDEDDIYKPFRARPMPSSTKQSIGVGKGHKSVSLMEARPFPLMSEERGRDKQALPAQRLLAQQKQDEAATSFRARPLPAPSKGFAPRRSERPPTEVREFRLSSRAHNKRAEVHALPPPVATIDPEPHPQRRKVPLTQPVEMTLRSSAARAGERRRWDMKNRARLDAAERRRLEEKEAVAELRRRPIEEGGMAFKAKPITRSSAPATGSPRPHGSTAPSTTPTTRNLRTTRRALNAAPR